LEALAIRALIVTMLLFAAVAPPAAGRAAADYRIPPDNPFSSIPGARGEIYM